MALRMLTPPIQTGFSNPKFVRLRASDGAYWNTSGTPAFEAYNAANIAQYGIAATEEGVTGRYYAADPAEATAGTWEFYSAAGASLAVSDLLNNLYAMGDAGPPVIGGLTAAEVNAEVVDALVTDTYAQPGQGAPAATVSLASMIRYLYKAWRNKSTQTSAAYRLYDDAGSTVDQKATTSSDGTTFTREEVASGP